MSNTPQLSVIVASYNSRRTIANCLESLRRQVTDRAFEVVVVDSSNDGTGDLVAEQFPEVRLLRFEERKYPGDARNAGIEAARADIVASVDADCEAREDWVEQILEAHRDPSVAIGGAIGNANPASYVGWAAYLCEFSHWMPGAPRRWLTDIATANMSYKKWVFQKYGRFIEGTYGSDTDFNWRLGRDGHRLLWTPSMVVTHRSIEDFGQFLRHEFKHGRDCGRMRVASQKFSRLRRWFYAICFLLIPVKLYAVIAARNFRYRTYLKSFLAATPLLVLGLYSWSLGELVAYSRPAGRRSTTSDGGRAGR
jgi:glycosyltransferase involved in cell wall biosynthesis